jgi:glycine/D-amino acid oxidase-like deaminating enzyme/nitrite reductase/ring-hydroxylating ferredoxin subunit
MSRSIPTPRNPAYWSMGVDHPGYPALAGRASADVAVVGAGITGLTTALLLKREGLRVVVLDAGRVGGGITGHSTAKVTSLHALTYATLEKEKSETDAAIYARANQWAVDAIAELVGELGIDCGLERRPALTYTVEPGSGETIEREVEAARRAGLPAQLVRAADLPFPIVAGVLLEDQALFDPLRYVLGLAREVDGDGSVIHEGTRAVDVVEDTEPLRVVTEDGNHVEAEFVVLACGLPFLDRGGFFARSSPSRSYCLALETDGPVPGSMSINIESPTRSVRPIPRAKGDGNGKPLLLVAGESHKVGQADDTEERYVALEAFAHRHFPVNGTVARWSSQDYIPVDGVPLIGRMPLSSEGLLVATGFRKWGLTTGMVAARIFSDLIRGRDNPWASLFDAGRAPLPDGAGEALKANLNVLKRFVGDRIRQRTGDSPEELAPGMGGICRMEGEPVAAFRDESGELRLLSPVCTHMGCRVTWNRAERSWDCPCHGSRFDVDGRVLVGPAVAPLEKR